MKDVKIPDGWTLEERRKGEQVWYLEWPYHGAATLYETSRDFALGLNTTPRLDAEFFSGRGWRQRLVDAAVAHLIEICGDKASSTPLTSIGGGE